jgi:hypothetical protein
MQTMVGMLIFGKVELEAPLGVLSPWYDMLARTTAAVNETLERQTHRRFLKTHTPLDGLPWHDEVTYLAVIRHPLDVALSKRDHSANVRRSRLNRLLAAAAATEHLDAREPVEPPEGAAEYLRWWIAREPADWVDGAGSLSELVRQAQGYWVARRRPNVHLFHYQDLRDDLEHEMRRLAEALGVTVEAAQWPLLVAAAHIDAMRQRASALVPETDLDMWESPERFFDSGGRRNWADLLSPEEITHYRTRLRRLAGPELADWIDPPGA